MGTENHLVQNLLCKKNRDLHPSFFSLVAMFPANFPSTYHLPALMFLNHFSIPPSSIAKNRSEGRVSGVLSGDIITNIHRKIRYIYNNIYGTKKFVLNEICIKIMALSTFGALIFPSAA